MILFPAYVGSKKMVLGVAGPLASVWSWGLGSSRGSGVRGKSENTDLVDTAGQDMGVLVCPRTCALQLV